MSEEPIIAVQRVTKQVQDSTGTLTILHEIDFTLAPRQSAAIVGASGSGKSTLLSIVAGLDTPTQGTVRRKRKPTASAATTPSTPPSRPTPATWRASAADRKTDAAFTFPN